MGKFLEIVEESVGSSSQIEETKLNEFLVKVSFWKFAGISRASYQNFLEKTKRNYY